MTRTRRLGSMVTLTVSAAVFLAAANGMSGTFLPFKGPKDLGDALLVQAILRGSGAFFVAGAVGLLTATRAGLWLGRASASLIVAAGVYLVLWLAFIDESAWRDMSLVIGGGAAVILITVGTGLLLALRDAKVGAGDGGIVKG